MGDNICESCIGYAILAFILSPVILQGIGMFSSNWIEHETCSSIDPKLDCCSVKRVSDSYWNGSTRYTNSNLCDPPFSLQDLDSTASSFQAGAFSILILPFIFVAIEIWCARNDDGAGSGCCGVLGGVCFLLYPVAGLLSFIGCMIIAGKFSGSTFGSSFNYCLASGLSVLAVTGLLIVYICYKRRTKRSKQRDNTMTVQSYPSSGAAAPYDIGPANVHVQAVSIQQTERAVVHDPESGGFVVFMKSVNIFHMVTHAQ